MSVALNTKHLSGFISEEEYAAIYPQGLGGGAGLGDDVDGEALALAQADDIVQVGGADAVAAEVDLQTILQLVVVHTLNGLHNSACAQIAAADTGHDQNVVV